MLTGLEKAEQASLRRKQAIPNRYFSQEEFDRLCQLNKKAFENVGSPEIDFNSSTWAEKLIEDWKLNKIENPIKNELILKPELKPDQDQRTFIE